jgi:hypothetical protein
MSLLSVSCHNVTPYCAYPRARLQASQETGLDLVTFPATCPYTSAQILDDTFFPITSIKNGE